MKKSPHRLAFRLLLRGLYFKYLRSAGKPSRPQALTLEVTNQCLARCIMCNIWKTPKSVPELPLEQWLRLLSSSLFSDLRELDITGGEPFLRRDLPDLIQGICRLKRGNLSRLGSIAITTNGLLTRRVLEISERMATELGRADIQLVLACAVDATNQTHDKIRRVPGAWDKVSQTITGLIEIKKKHPNLVIGLKTTVLPINIDQLEGIADFAAANGLFTIISPCIVTPGRYRNQDIAQNLAFSAQDRRDMLKFFEGNHGGWSYHNRNLAKLFREGRIKKPCTCGYNYLFVRSTGQVHLCPLMDFAVGNIKTKSIEDIFFSRKAKIIRRRVGRDKTCRTCTEPGLERYALWLEGLSFLSVYIRSGKREFMRQYNHLGLKNFL